MSKLPPLSRVLAESFETSERPTTPEDCGVVTTGAGRHFPGVQLLYETVVRTHANLRVAHVEVPGEPLSREQARWAARQPRLDLCRMRPEEQDAPDHWFAWWHKPALIRSSPFRRTLWLDADCLVLRSLVRAFEHMEANPLFLLPHAFRNPNLPQLRRYFDLATPSEKFEVCAGVVGYNRARFDHAQVMATWGLLIRQIAAHPDRLERFVTYADEGVLRLALQALGKTDIAWPDRHWNFHVWHGHPYRMADPERDLSDLLFRWPEQNVLHFAGRPKIWDPLHVELLDTEPHG